MKRSITKCLFAVVLLTGAQIAAAQTGDSNTNWFLFSSVGIAILLLLWAILSLSDNLMHVEASKSGMDTEKENFGLLPSLTDLFGGKAPRYATEGPFHSLKKGYNLKLIGAPEDLNVHAVQASRVAVMPPDFLGISPIPKVEVEVGDEVLAGQVLFYDKKRPDIKYTAPVSGEIVSIDRGAKRSIAQIVILADKQIRYLDNQAPDLSSASRQDIVTYLAATGGWTLLNQRPFDLVPDLDQVPRDIFISTFDTAPLAPDGGVVISGREAAFQKGLDVLGQLTPGKVYLGLDARSKSTAPAPAFAQATGVDKHYFAGAHPAGNVGVQIHHIKPINSGEYVWTLGVQEVAQLGELFLSGKYDAQRVVVVTGAEVAQPVYVSTYQGASIADLLGSSGLGDGVRIISGDVLSGKQTTADSFVKFRDDQITVIAEGDNYELFGWLLPLSPRPSVSNTFPAAVMPNYKYEANSNTHGERRALVVSGLYESVTPMDIYPQHLVKAILTNDIEKMEGLGIYEISEEDLALCEFVCASKTPVQSIVRDGLNTLREQL